LRPLIYLNPLALPIEMARAVLLGSSFPPALLCFGYAALACIVFRGGFAVFTRYKGILADVI
jgi:ABC-type polysaccharide/polyol phosphate export permease